MLYIVFLFAIIVILTLLFKDFSFGKILRDPFALLILMLAFVHLAVPLLVVIFDVQRNYPDLDYSSYSKSSVLLEYLTICFIMLTLGYTLFRKRGKEIERLTKQDWSEFNDTYLYILFFIFLIGSLIFLFKFGPIFLADPAAFLSNRINEFSGYGYLKITTTFSSPVIVILYYKYYKNKSINYLILIIVSFSLMVILAIITGSRGSLVQPILFISIFKLLFEFPRIRSRRIIYILVSFILIFDFLAFLGGVRQSRTLNINKVESRSPLDELVKSFDHTEYLYKITTLDYSPVYGKTYVAAIAIPIPRALWPQKPVGGGPLLKNTLDPGSYSLGKNENNSSLTTGIFLEAYLNFGFAGCFIVPFLYGALFAFLLNEKAKGSDIYKSYYLSFLIILMIILFPSGEFLGSCSRLFTYFFPFLWFRYRSKINS